jgi:hypothetical protein
MLFSHNISTPLPQPKSLINNAEPPGQAIGGGTFCAQVQKVARRFAQIPRAGDQVYCFAAGLYPTDAPPSRRRAHPDGLTRPAPAPTPG